MKHISTVSRKNPAMAALWHDIVAQTSHVLDDLLAAKGGFVPFVSYLAEKTTYPDPEE